MNACHHIDPVRVLEEVFYTVLHRLFHSEGARTHFGFAQINFFTDGDGLPGWNLWFDGCDGAYQLILVESGTCGSGDDGESGEVTGRWAIRYFPAEDEAVLETFSTVEALARLGPLFDHTGTPANGGQARLDADLFVVGHLDVRVALDRHFIEIAAISQRRWCEIRTDGLRLATEGAEPMELVAPGAIDRNVPGWELSAFFQDKLVCGLCHAYGTAPAFTLTAQRAGTRLEIDANGQKRRISDSDSGNEENLLLVALPLAVDAWGACCLAVRKKRVVHRRLRRERWMVAPADPGPHDFSLVNVNPHWWHIKEQSFDACHGEHEHLCCYADH